MKRNYPGYRIGIVLLCILQAMACRMSGAGQVPKESPLITAVKRRDIAFVRALLAHGAKVNQAEARTGRTALMEATLSSQAEMCLLLLQSGANANSRDSYISPKNIPAAPPQFGETALCMAARAGNSELVMLLAEHGADVNAADGEGDTPLVIALKRGEPEVVRQLLLSHADPNRASPSGLPPLAEAMPDHAGENIALLIAQGAKVNAPFTLRVHFQETPEGKGKTEWDARRVTPLILQAARGNLDSVKCLLDHGADPNLTTSEGQSALMSAVMQGRMDLVELLLARKADVNQIANSNSFVLVTVDRGAPVVMLIPRYRTSSSMRRVVGGGTPLVLAAGAGNLEIVRLLLANKAELNAHAPGGLTALMAAAEAGHTDICRLLLANKAEVDARNANGTTALFFAAAGHLDTCRLLIESKADVNAKDVSGYTPLMAAAGSLEVVQFFLAQNAEINAATRDGMTPLLSAVSAGHKAVARLLIDHAANVNACLIQEQKTPLMLAAAQGDTATCELLLRHGAEVTRKDNQGVTALAFAVMFGKRDLCELLLRHGADVNQSAMLLNIAIRNDQMELCQLLIDHKASVNAVMGSEPPLLMAVRCRNRRICMLLLANGADVNVHDAQGVTPLMAVAGSYLSTFNLVLDVTGINSQIWADMELCRRILEAGADVNARDNQGRTALLYTRQFEVVRLLIEHKANVNVVMYADPNSKAAPETAARRAERDQDYQSLTLLLKAGAHVTPEEPLLFTAILQGNTESVRALLAQGVDVNRKDRFGFTALDCAAFAGAADAARLLIERGADVNGKDGFGRPPLTWAATPELCTLLLQQGAKVNARDREGFTPLLRAVAAGNAAIVQCLLDNGADYDAKSAQGFDVGELTGNKEVKEVLRTYHSRH